MSSNKGGRNFILGEGHSQHYLIDCAQKHQPSMFTQDQFLSSMEATRREQSPSLVPAQQHQKTTSQLTGNGITSTQYVIPEESKSQIV